jgi:ABC-type multidrug transport system fused ATPase/permease subunit
MTTSKRIGRLTLLKYCFLTLAIMLTLPAIIGLTYQLFTDKPLSVSTFYGNLLNDLNGNEIFIIVQTLVLLTSIWFIGGWTGRLIIDQDYPNKIISFLAFFTLWIALFISCALTGGLIRSMTWGVDGLRSSIIGWLAYGLFPFLIAGIINGFTIGLLFGNELKKKKQRHANVI